MPSPRDLPGSHHCLHYSYMASLWGHPFLIPYSKLQLLFFFVPPHPVSLQGTTTVEHLCFYLTTIFYIFWGWGSLNCYSTAISPAPRDAGVQCNIMSEEMRRLPLVKRESRITQGLGFSHKASITLVEVLSLLGLPFSKNCSNQFLTRQLVLKLNTFQEPQFLSRTIPRAHESLRTWELDAAKGKSENWPETQELYTTFTPSIKKF